MEPLATLFDRSRAPAGPTLSPGLRKRYGGDLAFTAVRGRPHVVANFVSTLDGVVSYGTPGQAGGGVVSGFNEQDAFVMGLLRASADAVMIGAGTLHGDPGHVRTASFVYPKADRLYRELRRKLGKRTPHPLNVIVSGSGRVDLSEPTFHTPDLETVILTSGAGARRLRAEHESAGVATNVRAVAQGPSFSAASILAILYEEFGVRLLLHEGGPTLFGRFLAAGAVDELFLTVAPRAAGRRRDQPRLSLVAGTIFPPEDAPRFHLLSVKRARHHLFLRYRVHGGAVGSVARTGASRT